MKNIFQLPEEIGASTGVFENDVYLAEEYLEGQRCFFIVKEKENVLRIDLLNHASGNGVQAGQFTDASKTLKHLGEAPLHSVIGDAVLDGVIFVPEKNKLDKVEVLCSGPTKAEKLQDTHGKLEFAAFDILKYKGVSLVDLPFFERRKYLELTFSGIGKVSPHLRIVDTVPSNKREFFNYLISQKGRGVILKSKDSKYEPGKTANILVVKNKKQVSRFNITLSKDWNTLYQNVRYTDHNRKFDFTRFQAVEDLANASNERKLKGLIKN